MKKGRPLEIAGTLLVIGLLWSGYKSAPAGVSRKVVRATLRFTPAVALKDQQFVARWMTGQGFSIIRWDGKKAVVDMTPELLQKMRGGALTARGRGGEKYLVVLGAVTHGSA